MTGGPFHKSTDTLTDIRPFRPSTIELVGVRRFEADHPNATVERDGTAVYVSPGGAPIWFDRDRVTAVPGDVAGATA